VPLGVKAMSHIPGFFVGTEMPTAGWWEALWPDPAGTLANVGVRPGATVVDLCSGDGWFTLQIAKIAQRVISVDIDAGLLDIARSRLSEQGVTNCDFVSGDAYAIADLVREPVDFVFLANAFHGVPDKPRLARGVRSILKADGRFAVVNWHKRPREETMVLGEPRGPRTELRLAPEETIEAITASGLQLTKVVEIPPYHYAALFEAAALPQR
jgi:ubiquinone/menaquinone biosynthesis C-methylase UbiE